MYVLAGAAGGSTPIYVHSGSIFSFDMMLK